MKFIDLPGPDYYCGKFIVFAGADTIFPKLNVS